MEGADGSAHPQDLRDIVGKFCDGLNQKDAWDCVQHLFVPNSDKHEILEAIAHCHIASFDTGNEYLSARIGQAHIDSSIRCLLEKLTGAARDAMLKEFPLLIRTPQLGENASFQSLDFPPLVLMLPGLGLRVPLDQRHVSDESGDGGLRTQETEHLLARIRKEEARQITIEPDSAHTKPAPDGAATHTDHWLKDRLRKFQPSFSAQRDPYFSLNAKVEVDGKEVVCRHIAVLWEEEFMRTAGKPTYQTLKSPAALQEAAGPAVRSDMNSTSGVVGERVDRAQYWMSNDWGRVLTENFNAMLRQSPMDGAVCRTLYLVTPNHAMALGLKIKDDAGARRYVVQFYDPNNTVSHQRAAITATADQAVVPAEIRTLKPQDFLTEHIKKEYLLIDAENRPLPALFLGQKVAPGLSRLSGEPPELDEHVMRSILVYNLVEQLHTYADQLKLSDENTRFKTLTGPDYASFPGLFVALERGNTEVVQALGEILKACQPPLSPAHLTDLLSAKSRAGTPGLTAALHEGETETVKAFGRLLNACEPPLSSEQLMTVLSARNRSGIPGLWNALLKGHDETVEAFAEILTACASRLTSEQFLDLLQMKLSANLPALYVALLKGDTKWIEAYGKLLGKIAASLPTKPLAELLALDESEFGRATLQATRKNGHIEALAAFEALKAKFAYA